MVFCIILIFYNENTLLLKTEQADLKLKLNLNLEKWDKSLQEGPNEFTVFICNWNDMFLYHSEYLLAGVGVGGDGEEYG